MAESDVAETLAGIHLGDYDYPGYHLSRMSEPLPAAIRYRIGRPPGKFASKGDFRIMVNVSQFHPEEVSVKVVDNGVVIHAKHEEKTDEHGFIEREFTRRYVIPEGFNVEAMTSWLSQEGVLIVRAPKSAEQQQSNERILPITLLGTGDVVERQ